MQDKDHYLIGQIKSFIHLNETAEKKKAYRKKFVNMTEENRTNIGVPAICFALDHNNKTLKVAPMEIDGYTKLSYYHLTIPAQSSLMIKKNVIRDDVFVEIRFLIPDITEWTPKNFYIISSRFPVN